MQLGEIILNIHLTISNYVVYLKEQFESGGIQATALDVSLQVQSFLLLDVSTCKSF